MLTTALGPLLAIGIVALAVFRNALFPNPSPVRSNDPEQTWTDGRR